MGMRHGTSNAPSTERRMDPTFQRVHPELCSTAVADLKASQLAAWLRHGLEDEVIRGLGARAYVNAESFIFTQEDRPGDLAALFNASPPGAHPVFREAARRALAQIHLETEEGQKVADPLLRFARLISASEVLEEMAAKASNGDVKSWSDNLFVLAFELAAVFVGERREEAATLLTHIIRRRGPFPPALSGLALVTLTSANFKRFTEHFAILRTALESRYGLHNSQQQTDDDVGEDIESERSAARERLARAVLRVLPDRALLVDPAHGLPPQWWLDALTCEGLDLRCYLPPKVYTNNSTGAQHGDEQANNSDDPFNSGTFEARTGLILSEEQRQLVAKAA